MTNCQNRPGDAPPLCRSLGRVGAFASRSSLALCLPRRLGDVLPNRAAPEMFRDVAPCSAMSHHVAHFSLYEESTRFFHLPEAAARSNRKPPRRLDASRALFPRIPSFLISNSAFLISPMCASRALTRISRAVSRDKCAFTCANVRQCVPPWRGAANFSRARGIIPKIFIFVIGFERSERVIALRMPIMLLTRSSRKAMHSPRCLDGGPSASDFLWLNLPQIYATDPIRRH